VKASDKWIRLGVDASSSQVPTALSQYEVIQPIEAKQARPRHNDRGRTKGNGRDPQLLHDA
jgi:hypothetical protein